jgi:ferric-dicitrate binding protein FerR (iron transport regulator)
MSNEGRSGTLLVNRRTAGGLLLAGVSSGFLGDSAWAEGGAAQVSDLFGIAQAEARAARRDLAKGESVYVGETVMTGMASRIGLLIGEATLIRLGPEARLKIDRFLARAGGTLSLQSGPMMFDRPEEAQPQPVRINGAFGMIAVRGTRFFAGPNRGKSAVLVLRGQVSVRSGGETVELTSGQGTDIETRGGKPSKPAAWSNQRIEEALASIG